MASLLPKSPAFVQCGVKLNKQCLTKPNPVLAVPCRQKMYYDKGKNKGGRMPLRNKIPPHWRVVNFNPAQIPSKWKPPDYDEKHGDHFNHEKQMAKHIPGYKPKLQPWDQENYHPDDPLYSLNIGERLVGNVKQALTLTKSIMVSEETLPAKLMELKDTLPTDDGKVKQVLRHAKLFDVDPNAFDKNNEKRKHWFDTQGYLPKQHRCSPIILKELVRLSDQHAIKLTDKFFDRCNMTNHFSCTSFRRGQMSFHQVDLPNVNYEWNISLQAKPLMQVMSKEPLAPFAGQEEIDATATTPLISTYPVLPTIHLTKTHNYQLQTSTGLRENCPKGYLHTAVFEKPTIKESVNDFFTRMFIQVFTFLHAKSVELYGDTPQVLPQPLAAQAIGSDGHGFLFLAFQLNTTLLANDDGVKNMAWTLRRNHPDKQTLRVMCPMYTLCSPLVRYEPEYMVGYDPEIFKLFQAIWLNGLV